MTDETKTEPITIHNDDVVYIPEGTYEVTMYEDWGGWLTAELTPKQEDDES